MRSCASSIPCPSPLKHRCPAFPTREKERQEKTKTTKERKTKMRSNRKTGNPASAQYHYAPLVSHFSNWMYPYITRHLYPYMYVTCAQRVHNNMQLNSYNVQGIKEIAMRVEREEGLVGLTRLHNLHTSTQHRIPTHSKHAHAAV